MDKITLNSKIKDVYEHPVGRDVLDKILMVTKKGRGWITNPVVANIKLKTLKKILHKDFNDKFWDQMLWLLNSEDETPQDLDEKVKYPWWKEAVFYQIYPRSFKDSNNDGFGDILGIVEKLDYLKDLGITAIWLSPVYDSPNNDMGYDIRDYHKIMEEMGTMADFDLLLAEVHKRDMRLIMDLVINHTSDEHEWFQNVLKDPDSDYKNYYFIVPGKEEELPNNWQSFFGGPAWRYFPELSAHVMHTFSDKQLDLNWEHEPMREELYGMIRWWLEKGVDGFRLDVINYISKREGLPNGSKDLSKIIQFTGFENFYYGPKLHEYLQEMNREAFKPFNAFSVAETPGIGLEMAKLLAGEERQEFDMVFIFDHLESSGLTRFDHYQYDLNNLKKFYIDYLNHVGSNYWMSLFVENHDNPRMVSKVTKIPALQKKVAKLLNAMILTLRGTPFIFQGQELGARDQHFQSIDDMRDVEVINFYKKLSQKAGPERAWIHSLTGSRDHARVPMIWDEDQPNNGFSDCTPWLCGDGLKLGLGVAQQEGQPYSVLEFTKKIIAFRAQNVALRRGEVDFVQVGKKNYFAYYRTYKDKKVFVEMNLSPRDLYRHLSLKDYHRSISNYHDGFRTKLSFQSDLKLRPYEVVIYEVN